jgi:hypothetical protein
VGAYFGVDAIAKAHQSSSAGCNDNRCPNDPAADIRSGAQSHASIATVAIAAGALVAAGGAVLLLVAPSDSPAHGARLEAVPSVGPNSASVTFGGRF